jgi:hypothetical protein
MPIIMTGKLMGVEGAVPSFEVDVQQTDAHLSLDVGELTRDNSTFLSTSEFLDIEVQESLIGGEGDKVNRGLFGGWGKHITALTHQPLGGN